MKVKIISHKSGESHVWYHNMVNDKPIFNVIDMGDDRHYRLTDNNLYINKIDCELVPDQEGWLTEEDLKQLYHRCNGWANYSDILKDAKERGWIKQSKTAKQKLHEKYSELIASHEIFEKDIKELYELFTLSLGEAEQK